MIAQMIRAVLFAIATVATLVGFRASRSASRGSPSGFCFARRTSAVMNEQLAQVFVAHLADTTEPLFASARLLKWRQSQPGSELPPRAELMRIGNRCGKSGRADRPDTGDRHETTCNIVAT